MSKGPCNRNSLTLAARKRTPTVIDDCMIAEWKLGDEIMNSRHFSSFI